jgi:hypothetical protein
MVLLISEVCKAVIENVYPLRSKHMGEWWWMQALQLMPFMPLALSIGAGYRANTCAPNTLEKRTATVDASKLRLISVRALNQELSDPQKAIASESNILIVSSFLAIDVG